MANGDNNIQETVDLKDPKVFDSLTSGFLDHITFDESDEAYSLAQSLETLLLADPTIKDQRPEYADAYQKIIDQGKWVGLDFLNDNEVETLFRDKLMSVFDEPDFDIWAKIRHKLITVDAEVQEQLLKKNIIQALRQNNEIFTEESVRRNDQVLPGTVANWLRDYDITVGIGSADSVKFSQYLVGTSTTKSLSSESRERLRKLIGLYEKLKRSSLDPQNNEDVEVRLDDPEPKIVTEGRSSKINFDQINKSILDAADTIKKSGGDPGFDPDAELAPYMAAANLPPAPPVSPINGARSSEPGQKPVAQKSTAANSSSNRVIEEKKVTDWESKLRKETGGSMNKLSSELVMTINPPMGSKIDKEKGVALLRLLVQSKKMDELLQRDPEISRELKTVLKDKALNQRFEMTPGDPLFVRLFVKHLLVDKLKFKNSDAAEVAAELSALAKKSGWDKGSEIAYYDVGSKTFKWF